MTRISGTDIPDNKKVEYSVRYFYGIGPTNAYQLLDKANIDPGLRVKDLNDDQISRLTKALESFVVEGDLKREVSTNIKRLEEISSYRGYRHRNSLPVRGQRTKSNARTKRGRRSTISTGKGKGNKTGLGK